VQRTGAGSLACLRRICWRAGDSALGGSPWFTPAFRPPLTTRTLKGCCSGMQVACAAAIKSHVSARALSRLGRLRWLGGCWRLGRLGRFRGWWRCGRLDRSCLCELRRCGQRQDRGSDIDAALHEAASRLVWHCHLLLLGAAGGIGSPSASELLRRQAFSLIQGVFLALSGWVLPGKAGFSRHWVWFAHLLRVAIPGSNEIHARQWNGLEPGRGERLPAAPRHQMVAGQPGAQQQNRDFEVTLSWSALPGGRA
jgi:hypothetical protein